MWIIVLAVVVVIILWFIATYNGLVKLRTMVEEAFSTMDVYLKKRYDLIPNLVNTVKGYAKHESETLESVVQARSMAMNAGSGEERIKAEGELSQALGRLLAISEAYPDLKANQNFMSLQNDLRVMEQEIANSRKYYNGCVKSYNIKIQSIPSNIVASVGGFTLKPLFEVSDTAQRENVKVEF